MAPKKVIVQTGKAPYEIPNNWAWVKLSDLYMINPKVEAEPSIEAAFIPMEKIRAGFKSSFTYDRLDWATASKNHTRFMDGDVAFAKISPCFENQKSFVAEGLPNGIGGGTTELIVLRQKYMLPLFTYYVVNDYRFIQAGSSSYRGIVGQQRIKSDAYKKYLVAVPPYAEQERIVGQIENIFSLLDTIDDFQFQYTADMDALRSKLVDAGIRGKLTKQLPEDGTAEELYQQIQKEKKQLEKEGKIKKSNKLSDITEDVTPFKIPANWKWVRLGSISYSIKAGGDKPADFQTYKDENHAVPVAANGIDKDGIIGFTGCVGGNENTVTVAGRGTIGFTVYRNYDYVPVVRLIVIKPSASIIPQYLKYTLQRIEFRSTGSSIPQLTVPIITPYLIPLPPLAEQKRIVETLDSLLENL